MIRKYGHFSTQIAIQIRDFGSRITVQKVISIRVSQKILNRPSPIEDVTFSFRSQFQFVLCSVETNYDLGFLGSESIPFFEGLKLPLNALSFP